MARGRPGVLQGLVLTGGGARAAYQVGALRALAEITSFRRVPFQIVSGYSAGAINGAWLLSRADDFGRATRRMWDVWASITTDQVYQSDPYRVLSIAFRWIKDRSLGGMQLSRQINYLLDTRPLRRLLQENIDFAALDKHLNTGVYALSVTAVNYHTGHSVAFFEGRPRIREWESLNRISRRGPITLDHVMASSAIPIFFPPVPIRGAHYGDGMIRLNAPLSAPIHMGAERLLVIGIRGPSSTSAPDERKPQILSLGEIAGTILNGLFTDSLDADLARMSRVNRTLASLKDTDLRRQPDHLRRIPLLSLRPSEEVADLPDCQLSRIPPMIRFLLRGLGVEENKGQDLLSYLSFEPKYLRALLELGYEDTRRRRAEVLEHFEITAEKTAATPPEAEPTSTRPLPL